MSSRINTKSPYVMIGLHYVAKFRHHLGAEVLIIVRMYVII